MKAFIGFAGFGGPEIALHEVGIQTTSVEIDPAIAEVNRINNGGNVIAADILTLDPADFIGHWLARWIARFIVVVQPEYFTELNVRCGQFKAHVLQPWVVYLVERL